MSLNLQFAISLLLPECTQLYTAAHISCCEVPEGQFGELRSLWVRSGWDQGAKQRSANLCARVLTNETSRICRRQVYCLLTTKVPGTYSGVHARTSSTVAVTLLRLLAVSQRSVSRPHCQYGAGSQPDGSSVKTAQGVVVPEFPGQQVLGGPKSAQI